ncbi:MAG: alternative ribosome rescue aminoacyl-tRNA hydrolase ArfB [Gammaproteobacteria bacterium]|nr:alternative ribosome rescue aminoacyl-tRNA hydrolase ArfB [Gammaproteobacteria bacterium]
MSAGIYVSANIFVPESEIRLSAVRAQGSGGQNVNKVSSAIHLFFDIRQSTLPDLVKKRLLCMNDSRISQEGIIILKAQNYRSQEKNKEDALMRLRDIISKALRTQKKRIPTKVGKATKQRRLDEKGKRSQLKSQRRRIDKGTTF